MGRGYLLTNPKKSEVCTLGCVPSQVFVSLKLMILNLFVVELNTGWVIRKRHFLWKEFLLFFVRLHFWRGTAISPADTSNQMASGSGEYTASVCFSGFCHRGGAAPDGRRALCLPPAAARPERSLRGRTAGARGHPGGARRGRVQRVWPHLAEPGPRLGGRPP